MDAHTYLLSGLLTRHFSLGRVVRFRSITRGRQAVCHEVLTAEEREFLVQLYPAHFTTASLDLMAKSVNAIDAERFSVVPFQRANDGAYAVSGPQHTRMMVCLNPVGSYLLPDQYTEHDLSQLGLRVAWLHRLLLEQLDPPTNDTLLRDLFSITDDAWQKLNAATAGLMALCDTLEEELDAAPATAHIHGDLQPAAILLDEDHQLRCVMDFALLNSGDPLEDLLDMLLHWCRKSASGGVALDTNGTETLLESYCSLRPLKPEAWRPALSRYMARRLVTAAQNTRPLPRSFDGLIADREIFLKQLMDFSK